MRTILRLTVAQNARTLLNQPVSCNIDIRHLVAYVMHTAGGIFVKEGLYRRPLTKRMQQLNLTVVQFDEDNGDTMLWQILRFSHGSTQRVAVNVPRSL